MVLHDLAVQHHLNDGSLQKLFIEDLAKQFYRRFEEEQQAFLECIQGISSLIDRDWYGSLMLNRLMFVYFIQKKGFLDNNTNYLVDKLALMRQRMGKERFFSFYQDFLLRLFHEGLGEERRKRASDFASLLGDIPYLNGGLFERHELERTNTSIHIPDEAFARIFEFFESYDWHVDNEPIRYAHELNPDILGYIFEKYINQKQMGAYYTKEDITEYISRHTILPCLFAQVERHCPTLFAPDSSIWQLLRSQAERYIPSSISTLDYLPSESEQEYQARRQRFDRIYARLTHGLITSINDVVTENLSSQLFAQDVIDSCTSIPLLYTFYTCLCTLSILDPTCGSGAFLFAALNVLQPLYMACLSRMRTFLQEQLLPTAPHEQEMLLFFRTTLDQLDEHHNPTYFVLKAITINNLYGVDIMREATEICKLRLFLKLVAQLKSVNELEPLPDIDFNIRSGNTLVGFTSYEDVQRAMLGDVQRKLDLDQAMEKITQRARQVQQEYAHFRWLQTAFGSSPSDIRERKHFLRSVITDLRQELDYYLAGEYGIDLLHQLTEETYKPAFEQWRLSHQPFHWFVEFYEIMERGGFDVIIGNPPYIEYSKVRQEYTVHSYETKSCGNLYAAVLERSLMLCRHGQRFIGLIVPLSICGGERFQSLRETLTRHIQTMWIANFDIFPCSLFDEAYQRLSILLARRDKGDAVATTVAPTLYVTKTQRWYAPERSHLLSLIAFTQVKQNTKPHVFPKLASPLQESILGKVVSHSQGQHIAHLLLPYRTDHAVFYQEATNYWIKASCRVPFYRKNGVVGEPSHARFLFMSDAIAAQVTMALLNSSLFYLWFATYSDGFHLAHSLVKDFPIAHRLYTTPQLLRLAEMLEVDIQKHARRSTRNTKGDAIEIEEYRMALSKPLLDAIDTLLAQYYGFDDEELYFILNYDIKYRMGPLHTKAWQ